MHWTRFAIVILACIHGLDQPAAAQSLQTNSGSVSATQPGQQPFADAQPRFAEPGQPATTQAPFQLTKDEHERLIQLLAFWEKRSGDVKTYSCDFVRLEYDTVFGPQNPQWYKTQSEGIIRFASPDKGEFHITRVGTFQPPNGQGVPPTWPMVRTDDAEHWICDGNSIFELDASKKLLTERKLPPELQGKQISDGPLPFMFGATKEKILQKYWIRELLPPAEAKGEYWFEAFPKLAENAREFQKVRVILDEKTFLPNALQIFPPTFDGDKNTSRTVYTFTNRQVNNRLHRSARFLGQFISPNTPPGWKKVVEDFAAEPEPPRTANAQGTSQPAPANAQGTPR